MWLIRGRWVVEGCSCNLYVDETLLGYILGVFKKIGYYFRRNKKPITLWTVVQDLKHVFIHFWPPPITNICTATGCGHTNTSIELNIYTIQGCCSLILHGVFSLVTQLLSISSKGNQLIYHINFPIIHYQLTLVTPPQSMHDPRTDACLREHLYLVPTFWLALLIFVYANISSKR